MLCGFGCSVVTMLICVAPPMAPDIRSVAPDLVVPPMEEGRPAPGRRVRQVIPEYRSTDVYHAIYLPTDWRPEGRYPVLVEYAGNGPYKNRYGDISTGRLARMDREGARRQYSMTVLDDSARFSWRRRLGWHVPERL